MSTPKETGAGSAGPVLVTKGLSKSYSLAGGRAAESRKSTGLVLFRELDLAIAAGEMVAVIGRSGAGKSSLLHLLAGLDRPSSGEVWVGRHALHSLSADRLAAMRNEWIGYVWQFHYLLPEFSAAENVAMPLLARGVAQSQAISAARTWLERVELGDRGEHRSGELSGGEQQRVAIARALVTKPMVLLADEPTGDLDDETAGNLFSLLRRLCREENLAALLVTHNHEVANGCDRVLRLVDGRLEQVAAL